MDRLTEIRLWHEDVKMRFDDKPSRAHQDREVLLSEIDKLQAEVGRLRVVLRQCACSCKALRESCPQLEMDGTCPHLSAREALEAKS